MAEAAKVDYGLDAPGVVKSLWSRAAWTFAFGFALYFMNRREYPGPGMTLFAVLTAIAAACAAAAWMMTKSSRVDKLAVRDQLLEGLELKGDEKVLDVGCGHGLLAIGAAKRLKAGRVTGIDVWSRVDLSDNTVDAAKENAKIEGVTEKVRFETGDARKMVFPEGNFDVVVSSLALHNIPDANEREQAVREMLRVLKPGGRLAIFDIRKTPEYALVLESAGAKDVKLSEKRYLWLMPSQSVTARK